MYKEIIIKHDDHQLHGHITVVDSAKAWILFAHGSGSSRKSKRNNWVAQELNNQGFSTLLFDLLSPAEDTTYLNRFDIPLLAERLLAATSWLMSSSEYNGEQIGYFGASTGAAAALMATAEADSSYPIYAIVSRGGRPDLAEKDFLNDVAVPTLLIVGGHDEDVIKLNEIALSQISQAKLVVVPGATHLFEEPGALDDVVRLSSDWFTIHLKQLRNTNPFIEEHP